MLPLMINRLIGCKKKTTTTFSIEQTIIKHISNKLIVPQHVINHQSHLISDLGADSLDLFEIALDLEEEFDLTNISDQKIAEFQTVGDIIYYIQQLIQQEYETRL